MEGREEKAKGWDWMALELDGRNLVLELDGGEGGEGGALDSMGHAGVRAAVVQLTLVRLAPPLFWLRKVVGFGLWA